MDGQEMAGQNTVQDCNDPRKITSQNKTFQKVTSGRSFFCVSKVKNGDLRALCHGSNISREVHDLLFNALSKLKLDKASDGDLLADGGDGFLDRLQDRVLVQINLIRTYRSPAALQGYMHAAPGRYSSQADGGPPSRG